VSSSLNVSALTLDNKASSPTAAPADGAQDYLAGLLRCGLACRDAALAYCRLGWSALPLCMPGHVGIGRVYRPHIKDCQHEGKRPWISWKEYQQRLPTEAEILAWWRQLVYSNVGIALGPVSGLIRVDVDGKAGLEALLEKSRGDLPPTPEFDSGRADEIGKGLLYAIPPGVTLPTTPEFKGPKQELRFQGQGAQTVLPPSLHKSGNLYRWVPGRSPWEVEVAVAPPWVVEAMTAAARDGRASRGGGRGGGGGRPRSALLDDEVIEEGYRHTRLVQLAGRYRRDGLDPEELEPLMLAINTHRCRPPLEEAEVTKIAWDIGAKPKPTDNPMRAGKTTRGGNRVKGRSFSFGVEVKL
jgi:hypothetical protein